MALRMIVITAAPPLGSTANHSSPTNLLPLRSISIHTTRSQQKGCRFVPKLWSPSPPIVVIRPTPTTTTSFCFPSSSGETTETQQQQEEEEEEIEHSQLEEDNSESTAAFEDVESNIESESCNTEETSSFIIASLQSYKEALANNDVSRVVEIEALFKSLEDENIALERKVATLSEEMSYEKDRVLRIIADFDNFRKRTERERLSLVTNAQGEVVENLLPVLDNFERAKSQIKVETEGEAKINNSYQSIYKQFVDILGSLGVVAIETVGSPFDPMLHEAIMREDSEEFEEGIILEEFRKGFKLGDRLLRPAMVKVSAGPGPVKSESVDSLEEPGGVSETDEEHSSEPAHAEDL